MSVNHNDSQMSADFVCGINLGLRKALLNSGCLIDLVCFMDCSGEPCNSEEAVVAVGGNRKIGWWSIDLTMFKPADHIH